MDTGIGWALEQMGRARSVRRAGWNGPTQHISLQVPDEYSKMTKPYFYITTEQGDLVPWLCSQADLLAQDWELA